MHDLAGHPAVVGFRGVYAVRPGVFAIAMDYVGGGELWTHCNKHGPLPEPEARHITAQLLDALGCVRGTTSCLMVADSGRLRRYMHERRIAHRDLKLENIMVEKSTSRFGGWPTIKIIDFGLSQRLAPAPIDGTALPHYDVSLASPEEEAAVSALLAQVENCPAACTVAGAPPRPGVIDNVARSLRPVPRFRTTVGALSVGASVAYSEHQLFPAPGSVFYLAPEVTPLRAPLAGYGLAADIWSAGICLHVMLSSSYPFNAPTDSELVRILSGGPELCMDSEVWAGVSPQARDLVARMLSPAPEQRPTAAQAMRHDWFTLAARIAARERAALLTDAACQKIRTAAPAGAPSPPPSPILSRAMPCFRRRTTRVAPLLTKEQQHELAPAESPGALSFAEGVAASATSLLRSLQRRLSRTSQPADIMIAEAPAEDGAPPAVPLRRRRFSSAFGACLAPDAAAAMHFDASK